MAKTRVADLTGGERVRYSYQRTTPGLARAAETHTGTVELRTTPWGRTARALVTDDGDTVLLAHYDAVEVLG